METHSHTALDKDYIDHTIKFMEHRALEDIEPVLDRLNLEIIQVKLPCGFPFCKGFCCSYFLLLLLYKQIS